MNTAQVEALRALLAPSGWLEHTRYFARALHRTARTPHGLLIVGTPACEPWHLTAHLAQESHLAGLPELEPTLVRWAPPPGAPAHLSVGIDRLERAGRCETLLVVGSEPATAQLLERVAGARRAGTAIFALDRGDPELDALAHESLAVRPAADPVSFDGAQHLLSLAIGESGRATALARTAVPASGLAVEAQAMEALAGAGTAGPPIPGARQPGLRRQLARLLDAISGPQQD